MFTLLSYYSNKSIFISIVLFLLLSSCMIQYSISCDTDGCYDDQSSSNTPTPSKTPLTISNTRTPTHTPSLSSTHVILPSSSMSKTPTSTQSVGVSNSATPTRSSSSTISGSSTNSHSSTKSVSSTRTTSPTSSVSNSPTSSITHSQTSTLSNSQSITSSGSISRSQTQTPSISHSHTSSESITHSQTPSTTVTQTTSNSETPTISRSNTPTISDSRSPSRTSSRSLSGTLSETPTTTTTKTISGSSTTVPTPSRSKSASNTPSTTASISESSSRTQSVTPTRSTLGTLSSTPSITSSKSLTSTSSPTHSPSPSMTPVSNNIICEKEDIKKELICSDNMYTMSCLSNANCDLSCYGSFHINEDVSIIDEWFQSYRGLACCEKQNQYMCDRASQSCMGNFDKSTCHPVNVGDLTPFDLCDYNFPAIPEGPSYLCNNYETFVFGNQCNSDSDCSLLCYTEFYDTSAPLTNICYSPYTSEYTKRPILPCCCHNDVTQIQSTTNVCPDISGVDSLSNNGIIVGQFLWSIDRENNVPTLGSFFESLTPNVKCDLRCYGYKYNFIYFLPFYAKCCN